MQKPKPSFKIVSHLVTFKPINICITKDYLKQQESTIHKQPEVAGKGGNAAVPTFKYLYPSAPYENQDML